MVDAILFDSGRADIKPEGRQVLQKVAEVIGQVEDKAIRVEGHTDNVKVGGALARAFPSNWGASRRPAPLTWPGISSGSASIPPSCLGAVRGAQRLAPENDTAEGRTKTGG